MPKPLLRMVALLAAFCLTVSPDLAAFSPSSGLTASRTTPTVFLLQSIVPTETQFKQTPLTQAPISEARRESLLVGLSGPVLVTAAALWTAPATAQILEAERVRHDILNVFRERSYFKIEIEGMFDQSLVAENAGMTREQMHDAIDQFVRFIQQAHIVQTRNASYRMFIDPEKNQLAYNPAYWDDLIHYSYDVLIHEAVHFSVQQQTWRREKIEAIDEVKRLVSNFSTLTKSEMKANAALRKASRTSVASTYKAENQAWYLQMAFNAFMAHGSAHLQDSLRQRQQLAPSDPAIASLMATARQYDPTEVTRKFMYLQFYNYILLDGGPDTTFVRLLSPDEETAALIVRAANGYRMNNDEHTLLMNWSYDAFLSPHDPDAPGWLSQHAFITTTAGTLLVASLTALYQEWNYRLSVRRSAEVKSLQAQLRPQDEYALSTLATQLNNPNEFEKTLKGLDIPTKGYKNMIQTARKAGDQALEASENKRPLWKTLVIWTVWIATLAAVGYIALSWLDIIPHSAKAHASTVDSTLYGMSLGITNIAGKTVKKALRILILDDEEGDRAHTRAALEPLGHAPFNYALAFEEAADAALGLQLHKQAIETNNVFDVVLTDKDMKHRTDGLLVIGSIRKRERDLGLPKIPLFLITSYIGNDQELALALGVTDIIFKGDGMRTKVLNSVIQALQLSATTPTSGAAEGEGREKTPSSEKNLTKQSA